MISIICVVLAGYLIGRWGAQTFTGWRAVVIAILVAVVAVPTIGYLTAYIDAALFGGNARDYNGAAIGLGLAVALIEVPLIVARRLAGAGKPNAPD